MIFNHNRQKMDLKTRLSGLKAYWDSRDPEILTNQTDFSNTAINIIVSNVASISKEFGLSNPGLKRQDYFYCEIVNKLLRDYPVNELRTSYQQDSREYMLNILSIINDSTAKASCTTKYRITLLIYFGLVFRKSRFRKFNNLGKIQLLPKRNCSRVGTP